MVSSCNVATIHPKSENILTKINAKHIDKSNQLNFSLETNANKTNTIINKLETFRWFPSYRMLTATMLCFCFARLIKKKIN